MANSPLSEPEGSQNPSVLLSPEMVCSVRQHPLSGNSGRKRYNTLDFARQNRVPTGRFHPYWKPRIQGICHPFEIPAVLKSVYTNRKNGVCIYTSQNTKIPTVDPPIRRGKTVGIFNAAFIETGKCHASRTAAALRFYGSWRFFSFFHFAEDIFVAPASSIAT